MNFRVHDDDNDNDFSLKSTCKFFLKKLVGSYTEVTRRDKNFINIKNSNNTIAQC